MGELLCQVRDELKMNTRPSTPPNSLSSKWKSFDVNPTKLISKILPSPSKGTQHTSPHPSSKRLSQPTNPSYEFDDNFADKPVKDLSNISSRTERNSSKILQTSDIFHFTDFVTTGVYHDFSTYSNHSFTLDREYWKSVQHYFQAHKFPSAKWLMDDIKSAVTSKYANTIGKDKVNKSVS